MRLISTVKVSVRSSLLIETVLFEKLSTFVFRNPNVQKFPNFSISFYVILKLINLRYYKLEFFAQASRSQLTNV